MYADDTVLFSKSIDSLQNMLDKLCTYSTEYDIQVNIDKIKIVSERVSEWKGLYVRATQKGYIWTIKAQKQEK